MRLSLNWIKKFTDIDKRKSNELQEKISVSLTEVEKIESFRGVDTIIEIENKALTHRPDCFSHLGIAREISTIFKTNLKNPLPKLNKKKLIFPKKELPLKIIVENKKLCWRYTAIVLKNIQIKPSPLWIQERLLACNVKPINNVVDITNMVMLELGQPLHAFDYDKIKKDKNGGKTIIVRNAKRNERITTLDSIQRELKNDTLVIADAERAIAIAGIIGGVNTEISEETTTIVIESANFEPYNIRRTGKVVGLHTEATLRFEKGQDPNLTYPALVRTIQLLEKYTEAKIASSVKDLYLQKPRVKTITLQPDYLSNQIGFVVKKTEIRRILKRLEFDVKEVGEALKIAVPTFRSDINIPQDFVEEIARIYGYSALTPTLPLRNLKPVSDNRRRQVLKTILFSLQDFGLSEVYSYSFVSELLYKKCHLSPEELLKIKNPISPDLKCLRDNLVPSLIEKAQLNCRYYDQFGLFEIGKEIHRVSRKKLPFENKTITALYLDKNRQQTFFTLKGIVEGLFKILGFTKYQFVSLATVPPYLQETQSAEIRILKREAESEKLLSKTGNKEVYEQIGIIGNITSIVKTNFDLSGGVTIFNLNLEVLLNNLPHQNNYQQLPRFPSVFEDISLLVSDHIPVETIRQKILTLDPQIINAQLKETPFTSEKLGDNKKSLIFTIEYQNPSKTLTSSDTTFIRTQILQVLKKEFQAQLRQ